MKVAITVHPLRHNASSNGSGGSTGAQGEASAAALRTRSAAWLAATAVAVAAFGAFC